MPGRWPLPDPDRRPFVFQYPAITIPGAEVRLGLLVRRLAHRGVRHPHIAGPTPSPATHVVAGHGGQLYRYGVIVNSKSIEPSKHRWRKKQYMLLPHTLVVNEAFPADTVPPKIHIPT